MHSIKTKEILSNKDSPRFSTSNANSQKEETQSKLLTIPTNNTAKTTNLINQSVTHFYKQYSHRLQKNLINQFLNFASELLIAGKKIEQNQNNI